MTDSKNKDIAQKFAKCLHAYTKSLEMSYFKGISEIQAYIKPTLSLHYAYTKPTQNGAKLGKSVTKAS